VDKQAYGYCSHRGHSQRHGSVNAGEDMSIEAMKQALEALQEACGDRCNAEYNPCHARTAITSLRQAIEQAEKQEPVAWQDTRKTWVDVPLKNVLKEKREWVGLTDEEIDKCCDFPLNALGIKHVRNIEAKLKQKNGYAEEKNT
jgi:hypothetical protein